MINIGENLKGQREQIAISQSQLAKQTQIKQQNISRWENGTHIPNMLDCITLADFYGISLDELVGRDNYIPPTQSNIDKAESELFNKLPNLSYNQLLIVRDFIDKLIKQSNNK